MTGDAPTNNALLLSELRRPEPLVSVELRPPRSGLDAEEGMGAWIDLHHSLGRLTRDGLFAFLTDNAVGAAEEENLAHVGANLDDDTDLRRIIPILTTKHTLDYCRMFASRAVSQGFDALTVLGGDRDVGPPRCVPHGRDLRELLRDQLPDLTLGGWVNPHRPPEEQVGFLTADDAHADFALSQIVSHHSRRQVSEFLEAMEASGRVVPVVFGVFFYRSPNPDTLGLLNDFFPVPARELTGEFESGCTPEEVCARAIRALREEGADKVYVSNLGSRSAGRRLRKILSLV